MARTTRSPKFARQIRKSTFRGPAPVIAPVPAEWDQPTGQALLAGFAWLRPLYAQMMLPFAGRQP